MQTKLLSLIIVAIHASTIVSAAPTFRGLGCFPSLSGNSTGDSESHSALPSGLAAIITELTGHHNDDSGSSGSPSSTSFATASNILVTASINDDLENDVSLVGFGKFGAGHTYTDGDLSGEITSALGDITRHHMDNHWSTLGVTGFSLDLESLTGGLESSSDMSTATDTMTETFPTSSFTPSITTFFTHPLSLRILLMCPSALQLETIQPRQCLLRIGKTHQTMLVTSAPRRLHINIFPFACR
ncbi:hypothetical protein DFJ43DRAFT_1174014 [Lentinula guzmanii]|uniref:Uncharacterized protein n=1 Tax=Lentinula guzmanii TaxID=2804957 RepID=A0AA38J1D9_9AGAR|nr:hypothetical protein DFJ43DRAFT_1174014 [Lentinula guzmanii]